MPTIINGTTGVSLVQDTTITQPKMAPNVASGGPCFSAWQSAAQSIPTGSNTKIQFQSKEFDTNTCFDSTTNSRFTPNVAGYYSVTVSFLVPSASRAAEAQLSLYKNGVVAKCGSDLQSTITFIISTTALIYCNGTTDFIDGRIYLATAGTSTPAQEYSYFQAYLARSA